MATDTMWINTHKAVKDFFQVLTCKKCKQNLNNPQQFLNCGHFACAKCVGLKTDCLECKIPGEVSDITSDRSLNDLIHNLNIIREVIGLPINCDSDKQLKTTTSDDHDKADKNSNNKIIKKNIAHENSSISMSESVMSKSSNKRKVSENIPKNINKKNKKGETALHIACRSNHLDRVQLLIDVGANPNTKDNAGWTPLQEAANYNYYEVCETLLKAGALPDMCGYDNRTALHEAVIIDNLALASLLLNFNASKNVYDNVGKKPRDYCKSKEMVNMFKNSQDSIESKSEASHEISKTSDLNNSLNCTINQQTKIILYGSNLKPKNRKRLAILGHKNKLRIANSLSPSVTHVIIDTDVCNYIKLTIDILLSILYGKWILNSDCLLILIDSENITLNDLSLFQVNPPLLCDGPRRARENLEKQNPKLFNNCYFYFAIKNNNSIQYDGMKISKEDLMKLVAAGDGTILTREPRSEDTQGSLSPFHVAHDSEHSLHKCTHYIIYIPDSSNSISNSNRIIYNMPTLKSLPLMWFIESILKFELIDPIALGL